MLSRRVGVMLTRRCSLSACHTPSSLPACFPACRHSLPGMTTRAVSSMHSADFQPLKVPSSSFNVPSLWLLQNSSSNSLCPSKKVLRFLVQRCSAVLSSQFLTRLATWPHLSVCRLHDPLTVYCCKRTKPVVTFSLSTVLSDLGLSNYS